MAYEGKNVETIALHTGWRSDETTGSVAVPIHQTTSFQFNNTEHAASLFALAELGNIYTRIMNPTTAVLEERLSLIRFKILQELETILSHLLICMAELIISLRII